MKNTEQTTDNIWTAIKNNDKESFQKIFKESPSRLKSLKKVKGQQVTPILYIGLKDALNCLKYLKEEIKIDILTPHPEFGINIFHCAAAKGAIKIINYCIIENIVNIDARDRENLSPLHWAAYRGQSETAQILLEAGCEKNPRDNQGCTPLHWAAQENHPSVVKVLLNAGCEKNSCNIKGFTPLHLAAKLGDLETVETFINFKCELFYNLKSIYRTVFECAISGKNFLNFKFFAEKIIKGELLIHGFKVTNKLWESWVSTAVREGNEEIVKYLVETKHFVYDIYSLLDSAIAKKQWIILDYLLEVSKADISAINDRGLDTLVKEGGVVILKSLLESKKIGVDFKVDSKSLLDLAIYQGNLAKVKFLFEENCKFSLSHLEANERTYEMANSLIKEKFAVKTEFKFDEILIDIKLLKLCQYILNLPEYIFLEPALYILSFNNYMAKYFLRLGGITKAVEQEPNCEEITLKSLISEIQETLFSFTPLYTIVPHAENHTANINIENAGNQEFVIDELT